MPHCPLAKLIIEFNVKPKKGTTPPANSYAGRKTALTNEINGIKKAMQKFATKWDKNAGWFGSGFKKVGNKKTMEALESAFSAMKKGKAGKYGAIAAAGAAVLSFLV